jgi:hypothetical protein
MNADIDPKLLILYSKSLLYEKMGRIPQDPMIKSFVKMEINCKYGRKTAA